MAYVKWELPNKRGGLNSNSKWVKIKPDVVEYDRVKMKKPLFDLILGTRTMRHLGIILNFQKQVITIDEIELPMQSIEKMPASRKMHLSSQTV